MTVQRVIVTVPAGPGSKEKAAALQKQVADHLGVECEDVLVLSGASVSIAEVSKEGLARKEKELKDAEKAAAKAKEEQEKLEAEAIKEQNAREQEAIKAQHLALHPETAPVAHEAPHKKK